MSPVVIAVIGIVVLLVLLGLVVITRYKVAGPSEAFIITGRRGKKSTDPVTGLTSIDNSGQKVVVGGGVFVVPFVQQKFTLDLSSRHIPIAVRGAVTLRGVKSNLEGVAIVKVGGSEDAIRAAAQRFLQQQDGIVGFTQEVLSGALRAIVGRMSVEDIIRDRAAFAGQVAEEAEASLSGQGLILDAFQIQDITTEGSYLEDLGRPEAARAKQEADIAEAIAKRASEQARLKAAEEIAIAERTYYLKQAEIKAETEAAAAKANAAGPLAEAARQQEVLTEQEKVAERQAALTDRELDTKVRKPADAARYQAEQEAEARRIAQVKEAEADAERSRLTGQGEKLHRSALADAVRIEGEAEAASIAAKGAAEAEAMQKKADAFAQYGEAAVLQMLVEVLPSVVAKASEPLSAIDKMTVISTDGASQLARTVTDNVSQGMELLSSTTGVDLASLLNNLTSRTGTVPAPTAGESGTAADAATTGGPGSQQNGEIEIKG
ncbi:MULTISPECIES: flotillin family protein [Streptomyces]|uniref:flotillin family protein n=1 Tax=Streptomyces TaxID=1883 RepID=UPI0004C228C5|nr:MULTISPECIES: flotillin family protein [Streptomyces]MYW80733.1 flotillin family protein [Streptomyces sp. SID8369]NEA10603.1 flotillin family protein [Streptomyces sp. SID10692]KOG84936.1 band 7 protein [Streptomyces griseus subsp. rhodochrous]MBD3554394.1 flotillin family protein [Streptomyces sp. SP18CM02]QRV55909.1 flotillin family protein [Streptomyces californicus]